PSPLRDGSCEETLHQLLNGLVRKGLGGGRARGDPAEGPIVTACPVEMDLTDPAAHRHPSRRVHSRPRPGSGLASAFIDCVEGTYEVPPQPFMGWAPAPFSAVALPLSALNSNNPFDPALEGTGRILSTNEWQDFIITRGSIDVIFPDNCRLLADFVAPVGAI